MRDWEIPMLFRPTPDVYHRNGTLWQASYDPEDPMAGLFDAKQRYFFRELRINPRWRWWKFWQSRWQHTGERWTGGDEAWTDFTLIPLGRKRRGVFLRHWLKTGEFCWVDEAP